MKPRLLILLALICVACGGDSSTAPVVHQTLVWTQPAQFADNTPLDPQRDIYEYEIHLSQNGGDWSPDTLRAVLQGVDNNGQVAHSFNLGLLPGAWDNGSFVSVRSIGMTGAASDYGIPCWWEGK